MNSSAFTVAVVPIIKQFHKTSTEASYLCTLSSSSPLFCSKIGFATDYRPASLQVLFMGFGALVWMPLIRIIGKRPGYLVSMLFLCIVNIWAYFSTTYGSLLASRIVGGFLTAASDAPVPSVVADLFFFHERGHAMMFFNFAISTGAFLGPLFNAYITQYLGWKWMCGVMAIVSGATFFVALVLLKETAYVTGSQSRDFRKSAAEYPPKRSYAASLGFTVGYDKSASFFAWMARTILLIAYPPLLIVGLTCGLFIGW